MSGARRLGLAHFAFYRAYLEGPDAINLAVLADTYFGIGRDQRRAQALLRELHFELAAAARRTGDQRAARLIGLPKHLLPIAAAQATNSPPVDWRAQLDPEGVFSERELVELHRERHGSAPGATSENERRALRAGRLHAQRLDALRRLETAVKQSPAREHQIDGWLDARIARRLQAVGLNTVGELVDAVNVTGNRWHTRVPRLGARGAAAIVRWLDTHAPSLGAIRSSALVPARSRTAGEHLALRAASCTIAPLEALSVPENLSGEQGANRARKDRCQISADDDMAAIGEWLSLYPANGHTWQSYRSQAERLLMWAIFERGKALSSMNVTDIIAYRAFLSAPHADWITSRATPRHSPMWRPFTGALQPSSRVTATAVLNSMFQWLVDMRYLDANPWRGVKASAEENATRGMHPGRALSRPLIQYVHDYIDHKLVGVAQARSRFLLSFLGGTGLRVSELAHTRLGDFSSHWLSTAAHASWSVSVTGKRSKVRDVPVGPKAMDALRQYLAARDMPLQIDANPPETPLLATLASPQGSMSTDTIKRLVKALFSATAGHLSQSDPSAARKLRDASVHWLRHTYATLATEANAPGDVVQENLGHASRSTMKIYVVSELQRRMQVADALDI